jgi:predicted nucleic acid-binding protein
MGSQTFLADFSGPIVADTSVVINLIATGCAEKILGALGKRVVVVDVVPAELDLGRKRGRNNAARLNELVAGKLVEIVVLGERGTQYLSELTIGPALVTLDDGEAATIAFAVEHACTALIDERKAIRICADRFPGLCIGSTVDILLHSEVRERLDQETLAVAAFNALQNGRMRVLPHHQGRIVQLIGPERAAQCQSLPRSVRFSPKSPIPNLF